MTPIPIALCGKHHSMCTSFIELMLPEYDVVHVCHSASAASSELALLLKGENPSSASDLGSNTTVGSPRVPRAIVAGGGFSQEEIEEVRANDVLRSIPWFVLQRKRPAPPPMEEIIERVKAVAAEQGFVEGGRFVSQGGEGMIWEC